MYSWRYWSSSQQALVVADQKLAMYMMKECLQTSIHPYSAKKDMTDHTSQSDALDPRAPITPNFYLCNEVYGSGLLTSECLLAAQKLSATDRVYLANPTQGHEGPHLPFLVSQG